MLQLQCIHFLNNENCSLFLRYFLDLVHIFCIWFSLFADAEVTTLETIHCVRLFRSLIFKMII